MLCRNALLKHEFMDDAKIAHFLCAAQTNHSCTEVWNTMTIKIPRESEHASRTQSAANARLDPAHFGLRRTKNRILPCSRHLFLSACVGFSALHLYASDGELAEIYHAATELSYRACQVTFRIHAGTSF